MVCSLLVAAVSVAAQLYIPILCGDAIDKMLGKGNVDLAGVLRIAVSILVVAAVAALAQWLLSVCNNRITFSVSRDLRGRFVAIKVLKPEFSEDRGFVAKFRTEAQSAAGHGLFSRKRCQFVAFF